MARKPSIPERKSIVLSDTQARAAIPKLAARLKELAQLDFVVVAEANDGDELDRVSQKANSTLRSIYGPDSIEYRENEVILRPQFQVFISGMDLSIRGNMHVVTGKVKSAITRLTTLIEILREQVEGTEEDSASRVLRSYEGLDLHPEIARAASKLYRDGHYSSAVEQSVKALNGLVRIRSGLGVQSRHLMDRI